jgi:signal peptidase I
MGNGGMKSSKRSLRAILMVGAVVLVVVLGLLPAYIHAYTLSGPSDAPTLLLGDQVWVMRGAYDIRIPYSDRVLLTRRQPSLGDLVQVASPEDGRLMFKRVAALPGDRVAMHQHRLRINGKLVEYAAADAAAFRSVSPENHLGSVIETEMLGSCPHLITFTPDSAKNSFAEVLVPPDHFFLLGDNRDQSQDSRAWGPVSLQSIRGRVVGEPHRP